MNVEIFTRHAVMDKDSEGHTRGVYAYIMTYGTKTLKGSGYLSNIKNAEELELEMLTNALSKLKRPCDIIFRSPCVASAHDVNVINYKIKTGSKNRELYNKFKSFLETHNIAFSPIVNSSKENACHNLIVSTYLENKN